LPSDSTAQGVPSIGKCAYDALTLSPWTDVAFEFGGAQAVKILCISLSIEQLSLPSPKLFLYSVRGRM
jgi:hypothetical protein